MKIMLALSMAAVMTLSSCAVFAGEETIAEVTDFNWAETKKVLDEADISGDYVSFDEAGMKVWIPDLYEETELTEEDIQNEYLGWYVSEEQEDGEYGQIGIGLYDMGADSIDQYIEGLKEAGYDSAEHVTVNGMDGALHFINEDGYSIQREDASEEASAQSDDESADEEAEAQSDSDSEESGDVTEYNWEDVESMDGADEMLSYGKFITLDEINCKVWVPVKAMQEVSLSDEEKEDGSVACFVTEDEEDAFRIQYVDASGMTLEKYKDILENMDGASEVEDVIINGVQGVAYVVKDQDSCHVAFTTDYGYILEFSWAPASNEDYAALIAIMMSSIQEA